MSDTEPAVANTAPPPAAARARVSRLAVLALVAVLLAAGLAVLSWFDARARISATQEELARRLREIESDAREARAAGRQAQGALREARVRVGDTDATLAERQRLQTSLAAL